MYACMYVCMYVCFVCLYVCMFVCLYGLYVCMYVSMYVSTKITLLVRICTLTIASAFKAADGLLRQWWKNTPGTTIVLTSWYIACLDSSNGCIGWYTADASICIRRRELWLIRLTSYVNTDIGKLSPQLVWMENVPSDIAVDCSIAGFAWKKPHPSASNFFLS